MVSAKTGIGLAAALLSCFFFLALFAESAAPHDPYALDLRNRLASPSRHHVFGTDAHGRDVFSRAIVSTRSALAIGFLAPAMASLLGIGIGLLAGCVGGTLDAAVMGFVDILKAFPVLLLALFVTALAGNRFELVVLAIGVAMAPDMIRLVRSSVLVVRTMDYVVAGRALGCSRWRIVTTHILPNVLQPLRAYVSLAMGQAILVEVSLGFLGFGVPPPQASLGNIIGSGMPYLRSNPWLALGPSLFVIGLVLSVNTLGDALGSRGLSRPVASTGFDAQK